MTSSEDGSSSSSESDSNSDDSVSSVGNELNLDDFDLDNYLIEDGE